MSEEAKDPERTIPRGTGYTVAAVLGPLRAAADHRPLGDAGDRDGLRLHDRARHDLRRRSRCSGIVENLGLGAGLTDVLRVYVGILAAVILVIATNAALIGVSRLTFSMGQHRQLPERLRQVHPRYRTPHVAIIAFSVVAAITLLPGQADLLATMYSFGAMLSFTDRPRVDPPDARALRRSQAALEAARLDPVPRLRAPAHRAARRARHLLRLDRRDGDEHGDDGDRRRLDGWSASPSTCSTAAARGCRSPRR